MISVVTVHGLWMRGASMRVLRRRLEQHGFDFHDFSYPSVTGSLDANAAALAAFLERVPGETVHLVGHSLGGVLACAMLETCLPPRIGRIVCLGAPLKGSRSAARLSRWPGGQRLIGKCLGDVQARGGFAAWRAGVEVGSIAGRIPLGLGRLFGPVPGAERRHGRSRGDRNPRARRSHRAARVARRAAVVDGRRGADRALSPARPLPTLAGRVQIYFPR